MNNSLIKKLSIYFLIVLVIFSFDRISKVLILNILEDEKAQSIMKMIEKFEEDDDVQNVFHNLEITEEIIRKI